MVGGKKGHQNWQYTSNMGNAESQPTASGRVPTGGKSPLKSFHPSLQFLCNKLCLASNDNKQGGESILIRNFWIVNYQFVRLTTPALPRIVVALFRQSTKAHIFHYSPSHAWFIPSFTLSANQVVSWTCPCCVACSDWTEMTITWLIFRLVQLKAALAVRRPIDAIKRQRHLSEIISSISSSPKANINRYYMCDLKMACTLTSCHYRLSV